MWKLTKKYFKDIWSLIWSKTEIDEKAIAAIEEIKRRYQLTSDEVADVIKTIKEGVYSEVNIFFKIIL